MTQKSIKANLSLKFNVLFDISLFNLLFYFVLILDMFISNYFKYLINFFLLDTDIYI